MQNPLELQATKHGRRLLEELGAVAPELAVDSAWNGTLEAPAPLADPPYGIAREPRLAVLSLRGDRGAPPAVSRNGKPKEIE
eukprot:CAMPEP_0195077206 /NCGR_PEP_ID=MMETSP0448-20130528/19699_1 /TAXON_ID=66468 /ORGANISM="Heterocapsa triquestra, Strain CCMP 448" /LENGTH=81 /DNA_ID=CAMNT_0040109817 /DNA_START=24 /DNA_END=267 /DNA_ORIENTATION=-